jgi:hypothetical protein
MRHQRFEQRPEICLLSESLNSDNLPLLYLHSQQMTGVHWLVIHQHRTGPTLSTITGPFRPGAIEMLAQHV